VATQVSLVKFVRVVTAFSDYIGWIFLFSGRWALIRLYMGITRLNRFAANMRRCKIPQLPRPSSRLPKVH
jgi:hypothetical protein